MVPADLKKQLAPVSGAGFVIKRAVFQPCLELCPQKYGSGQSSFLLPSSSSCWTPMPRSSLPSSSNPFQVELVLRVSSIRRSSRNGGTLQKIRQLLDLSSNFRFFTWCFYLLRQSLIQLWIITGRSPTLSKRKESVSCNENNKMIFSRICLWAYPFFGLENDDWNREFHVIEILLGEWKWQASVGILMGHVTS